MARGCLESDAQPGTDVFGSETFSHKVKDLKFSLGQNRLPGWQDNRYLNRYGSNHTVRASLHEILRPQQNYKMCGSIQ